MVSFFPDVFRRLPDPPKVRITNKAPNSPKPITSVFQPQNLVRYNTFTDLYFNGNVKFDSCNFSFDYEPQDNVLVNYPRIQYSLRNPLCAPSSIPLPPISPPSSNEYPVPIICHCGYRITLAFVEVSIYRNDGGTSLQAGLGNGIQVKPTSGFQLAPNKPNQFNFFKYLPGTETDILYTDVQVADDRGDRLFIFTKTFSESEINDNGGNAHIVFPQYLLVNNFQGTFVNAPWKVIEVECLGCDPINRIEPPPPPKKKDCKCMCCPGQQNSDALLKLVLKRIGSLPADVPTSYLTKNGVQPAQLKKVESLTEFIAWFAERFDETVGEFEITIEVDDADLSKEGKQKETIRLPNLAESIAEMLSMMIQSNINNELILNIVNRTLIESGQIKQTEFKTYSALNALIDYVGFHTTSQSQKMPLSFTVGEKSFDKFLKESEQDVSVLTYEQKETLTASVQSLLQAAAIIRAVNYRRTSGNKQTIASTVKNDLLGLLGETGNITDQVKTFITNMEKVYDAIDNKPN